MICRGRLDDRSFVINLTSSALTVSVGEREVMSWDRAGRLYSVWRDGCTYRRGLNGRVLRKWRDGERCHRVSMAPADADLLTDATAARLRQIARAVDRPGFHWTTSPDPTARAELREMLTRARMFDSSAARLDAARFSEVYQPIGILPPDQYLALVTQATEGCSFSTCTFCDLYRQPYRIRTPEEFRRHLASVRAFMGDSLSLRGRSIFLGAANALAVPMARLLPLLELIAEQFDGPAGGVHAFLDAFTGTRRPVTDYRALAALGLRRWSPRQQSIALRATQLPLGHYT